jgi:hypothetical protein
VKGIVVFLEMAYCHVDDDEGKNLEWKYASMLHCCFV